LPLLVFKHYIKIKNVDKEVRKAFLSYPRSIGNADNDMKSTNVKVSEKLVYDQKVLPCQNGAAAVLSVNPRSLASLFTYVRLCKLGGQNYLFGGMRLSLVECGKELTLRAISPRIKTGK
jgi:hypothetical protein